MADQKLQEIRELELFSGCRSEDLRWIAGVADTVDVPVGRTIVREGERVREFFVLVRGSASARSGHAPVALMPGSHVGAVDLCDDGRHARTIEATTQVRLLVFGLGAFRGLLRRMPSVGRTLLAPKVEPLRRVQEPRSLRAVS